MKVELKLRPGEVFKAYRITIDIEGWDEQEGLRSDLGAILCSDFGFLSGSISRDLFKHMESLIESRKRAAERG